MKNIFISHSSKNKTIANQFIGFLEHIGVKHNNIFCSSLISQGAKNGEDLNRKIGKAIKDSNLIIFLISQDFLKSAYCIEELGIGWYLSQESNKKCFYIIFPDTDKNELFGFVNEKVQKFTLLDNKQRDSFISLSEDICRTLNIKQKRISTLIEYINSFFDATENALNDLIMSETQRKNEVKENENKICTLQNILKDKDKNIEDYKLQLTKKDNDLTNKLLKKELDTIQKNFFILGAEPSITEEEYKSLSKQFWFKMINRYQELIKILKIENKNYFMEILIASIYTIENNLPEAYNHYIEYVRNCDSNIYYYYFDIFINRFKGSMKEIIEIFNEKIMKQEDGIVKDSYIDTKNKLEKREKELGFDN